jgi:hypothetical protein
MRTIEIVRQEMLDYKGKKTTKGYRLLKEELSALESVKTPLGLGDVVESITQATGIKKVVEVVSEALDIDCGCEERKKAWNEINLQSIKKLFRRSNVNELSEQDYEYLCKYFEGGMPSIVTSQDQRDLHKIYKNVFNVIKPNSSCSPCVKTTVEELYKLYKLNSK